MPISRLLKSWAMPPARVPYGLLTSGPAGVVPPAFLIANIPFDCHIIDDFP